MAMRLSTPFVGAEKLLVDNINLAASGVTYVRADCNKQTPGTSAIDWRVKSDKASTMLFYKSRTNAQTYTITLATATRVDVDDTCILNGVTLTAKASGTVADTWVQGLDSADLDAASLCACINASIAGVSATANAAVITIVPTTASGVIFGQGTSDANEIAFADNTLANLSKDAAVAAVTGAANNTTKGTLYRQMADGYPFCYLGYTDTSAAVTALTVGCSFHDSL